ncbi:MAG: hypothetical protein PHY93_21570 [Bacteriovorax sp.]|nr:hypothetical protein [Bacteriovorax sp.]
MPNYEKPTIGKQNPAATAGFLKRTLEDQGHKFQTIPLIKYLKLGLKTRGSGNGTLNSHPETFIVLENGEITTASLIEVNSHLDPATFQIVAINSIGNQKYQMVNAVVQGYNDEDPNSGYERPTDTEGPHVIIGAYGFDKKGNLHIFRTLQFRAGNKLIIDTPRGFCHQDTNERGQIICTSATQDILTAMEKILGEETGDVFQIKKITFLGNDVANSSHDEALSPLFAVEVDYPKFIRSQKVISKRELQRRQEQMTHEGLNGKIINFTVEQYTSYLNNIRVLKDLTADSIHNRVLINYLQKIYPFIPTHF